jgi:hypothetical protein
MIDVHVMKTVPPHGAFRIDLSLSPMCFSCPIAGRSSLLACVRTTVRVARP